MLSEARRWLDVYFGGQEPDFTYRSIPLALPFSRRCGGCCAAIPAARETTTYGALAKRLAAEREPFPGCSAQAVGGAVGHNVISIIIPCHRVVRNKRQPDRICRRHGSKAALLRLEMKMTR